MLDFIQLLLSFFLLQFLFFFLHLEVENPLVLFSLLPLCFEAVDIGRLFSSLEQI